MIKKFLEFLNEEIEETNLDPELDDLEDIDSDVETLDEPTIDEIPTEDKIEEETEEEAEKESKGKTELFSHDSGFDTRKALNRSDEIVPKEILDDIEKGISLETLNKIDLPIFKYKTQITIHGQFGELNKHYVGRYKSLFQNQNKSIGVKWNAIDYAKKKQIYDVMNKLGWSIKYNSNEFYAKKTRKYDKDNFNELKKLYDQIDDSYYIGYKELYTIPTYNGKDLVLKVNVSAILKENVWMFLDKSFGVSESRWNEMLEEAKLKRERAAVEFEEKRKEKILELVKDTKLIHKVVGSFDEIPSNDCIMMFFNKWGDEVLIKKYHKNGVNRYQAMRFSKYGRDANKETINQRLKKSSAREEYIKEIFNENVVFLIKEFEGTAPKEKKVKTYTDFKKREISTTEEPTTENPTSEEIPSKEMRKLPGTTDVDIISYSDKSFALIGNTYPIKDKIKMLGGRFNKFLHNPNTKGVVAGWIFPLTKLAEVEKAFLGTNESKQLKYIKRF